jgi:serine-type D-Ala-D-Ala carboxypeptidase
VALVARGDEVLSHVAVGWAEVAPEPRPMRQDTIFDLASLTKPVAGATAALLLLEDGVWRLDDRVVDFIPDFGQHGKHEITLRHLLTHASGLAAWAPMYVHAREPEASLAFLCSLQPEAEPGTRVEYSDLGFSLIGHLVRRVTGASLDVLLERRVWSVLDMRDTRYCPPAVLKRRMAATERGNQFEQAMVADRGLAFSGWRDDLQVGEVNDGNAHYALGGISSHAGLFSTAEDLLRFALMYVRGEGGVLSRASIDQAVRNHTPQLDQARGLGWQLQPARVFGDLLSETAYGHTGFTGTSLVVDPARELIVILLTNRTHPEASNDSIGLIRPRFHNLVAASLG